MCKSLKLPTNPADTPEVKYLAIAYLIFPAFCLAQGTASIDRNNHGGQFNRRSGLVEYINRDAGDIASAPNEGLEELNQKIWRYHEFEERFLERDELDMLFIENHLKYRDKRSAVVLVGEEVAALVFLDEITKKAKHVSTFGGRNVYRIKQIGLQRGLLVRSVTESLADPAKKQGRAPASLANAEKNAMSYAESLVK